MPNESDNDLRAELESLRGVVHELRDQRDIAALFDKFFYFEDRKSMDDEWAESIFTEDVLLELPPEDYRGVAGLAAHITEVVALFGPTHHTTTDCHADIDGDSAAVRLNLTATHQHVAQGQQPLIVWGYILGHARRTDAGWRLSHMNFHKVMRSGDAPPGFAFDENLEVLTLRE